MTSNVVPADDDLVERVALAMFESQTTDCDWGDAHENYKYMYRQLARAAIASLSSELAQCRNALEGWQPIETAPKDGTDILAWWFGVSFPQIIRFTGLGSYSGPEWIQCSYTSASLPCEPTHWQPLPEPPALNPIGERDE